MTRPVPAGWSAAMAEALEEARAAARHADVPVGAVVLGPDGDVLSRAHNEREIRLDPTAHAEILALREAAAKLSLNDPSADPSAGPPADSTAAGPVDLSEGARPPTRSSAGSRFLSLSASKTGSHTGGWRLTGCTLVVTLEPCVMCAGAMIAARLQRCVFGTWDDKAGACGSIWDLARDPASLHRVEVVSGVAAAESAGLLRAFFRD